MEVGLWIGPLIIMLSIGDGLGCHFINRVVFIRNKNINDKKS